MDATSPKILPLVHLSRDLPHWDSEEVFHTGDAFFAGLLSEIERAEKTIALEMYIFELDALGNRVLEALKRSSQRGVQVRVMVDGVGSPHWGRTILAELGQAGVEAHIYRPWPWVRLGGLRFFSKLLSFRKMNRWLQVLNRRNHRKVCIIDQKTAWVGSFNVSKIHLREFSGDEAWRDTGVRVKGPEVEILQIAFERAWMRSWAPSRKKTWLKRRTPIQKKEWTRPHALIRVNFTQFLRRQYNEGLLHRIWTSRVRVWVTSAYFIPGRPLIRSLRIAAWAGVDVRILIPVKSDVRFVRWLTMTLMYGLLRAGVRVYQYHPRILHAKTILIDDWATIGSCNLNHRSFHHDLEVDVVVQKEESVQSLEKQFFRDVSFSEELTLMKWKNKFWLERLLGRILFFLRYWM